MFPPSPCSVRARRDDHPLIRQVAAVLRHHPEARDAIQSAIQPYLNDGAPPVTLEHRVTVLESAVARLEGEKR